MLNSTSSKRGQTGLSLIELMVGITVGMIVVAGASLMMTNQVAEHRRLTLETQIQQDLRATADLMLKEVRRAGSWAVPQNGLWAPAAAGSPFVAPVANPYIRRLLVTPSEGGDELQYSYSKQKERFNDASPLEDNEVNESTEVFGFKLDQGTIKFLLGETWQPMTDPSVLVVTGLRITLNTQESSLADSCENACSPATGTCPKLQQRRVTIRIAGRSAHDANVARVLQVSARVRNDELAGACS
ncbi:prepilin-type N-terminal cleavage/methylation domain-containing protein [Paucibacter sp. DJ1R-11]|uniref:PilW family protein n=1 Tax=Paucibacter sp. DJ1R-11 TaxID=2893556 RepID=UPI0021E478CC|nr:prepilin-type N-terminal cleavage/methylation domain-containing protein [Paucibacter sp. DJ1R-11]MCV2365988.1 prepilin-type N-terminal cleavage/methylation domain-containing protein [Paucibacter sp. DJ1R-11]